MNRKRRNRVSRRRSKPMRATYARVRARLHLGFWGRDCLAQPPPSSAGGSAESKPERRLSRMTRDVLPFPAFENAVLGVVPEAGKLDELHLYHGSRCNRACAFC